MTRGEIDMARTVFGDAIDYHRVLIKTKALPGRSHAYNGIIRINAREYQADYSLASQKNRATFIHELAHIWQEQKNVNVVGSAIDLFFQGGYSNKSSAYRYGDIRAIDRLSRLNIEQQATIVEHFYLARDNMKFVVFDVKREENCDFQKEGLRLLRPYFPQLRPSPECE